MNGRRHDMRDWRPLIVRIPSDVGKRPSIRFLDFRIFTRKKQLLKGLDVLGVNVPAEEVGEPIPVPARIPYGNWVKSTAYLWLKSLDSIEDIIEVEKVAITRPT